METILIKIIICSSVLIGLYYLFLEKEKSFRFNRFYLLFALVFSYIVPLLTIELPNPEPKEESPIIYTESQSAIHVENLPVETSFNWENLVLAMYGVVAIFLFIKMILTIIKIKKLKGNTLIINQQKVKLTNLETSPFSFFNTIYVNKNDVKGNVIDERILAHEQQHIVQKHSWDLLFIELLKVFSWFNPALYFYKKTMVNNHEFLADEAVLKQNFDLKSYQQVLLAEITNSSQIHFTHQFNFNNTKKRFMMMTKHPSKFAGLKIGLSIPVFAVLLFLFSEKTYASSTILKRTSSSSLVKSITQSSNQDPESEYLAILKKYDFENAQTPVITFISKLSDDDKSKLQELYYQMTKEEQNRQKVFFRTFEKWEKDIPTQSKLNEFLDSKKYGVWVDGKRIKNNELTKFKPSDFAHYSVSKLEKNAINYGKHYYQVDIMTNKYYENYLNEPSRIIIAFRNFGPQKMASKTAQDTIRPKSGKELPPSLIEEKQISKENQVSTPSVFNKVDKAAEFPGGMNALRQAIAQNFDTSIFKGNEGKVSTEVQFVVSQDGSVQNVTATGNYELFSNEAIRTVKQIMSKTKWKPAEVDGKPVNSFYKVPLQMIFETSPGVKAP